MSESIRGYFLMGMLVLLAWGMAGPFIISDWLRRRRARMENSISDRREPQRGQANEDLWF